MTESTITKYFRKQFEAESRPSPIDKFENSFNPGVKCAHCGMSRSQHGKGQMDHPFETRKQERDKFQSRLRQTEIRSGGDWNTLGRSEQERVQGILDGFFEDNMDSFDDLSRNDMNVVGKKWVQLKPSVKDVIINGSRELGVEAKDEIEFWNTATSGQKRRIATMLDINANVRWEQLTPAEQGSLAVWWDEGGGSKSIGGTEFYNYDGAETLDSRAEEQSDDEVRSWWEQLAPQRRTGVIDGSSQLRFNELGPSAKQAVKLAFLRKPIPDDLMMKAINGEGAISNPKDFTHRQPLIKTKQIGQTPPENTSVSFANEVPRGGGGISPDANFAIDYSGITDEEEEFLTFNPPFDNLHQGGGGSGGRGDFFFRSPSERANFMNLAMRKFPHIKFSNPAQLGESSFYQYETVKPVGNEGQKFSVTKDGTMLPKGNYEVLGKKTDQAHSGPWGTFSITTVKNLETGERHEIPTGNAQLIYGIEKKKAREFMDHGLRRQIERQIEDGAIESFQQVENIIKGSLGRAGLGQEQIDSMISQMKSRLRNSGI